MSITQGQRHRVLVVCLGNHCRSPLAAAVLARHSPAGTDIRSAGLAGKHIGKPAHPVMIAAAARLGYDLTSHRGTQVSAQLLDWAQLILAMDTTILTALRQARRAEELLPIARDSFDGPIIATTTAAVSAQIGEKDLAIEQLQRLIGIPNGPTSGLLRAEPEWNPLREDARFKTLIERAG